MRSETILLLFCCVSVCSAQMTNDVPVKVPTEYELQINKADRLRSEGKAEEAEEVYNLMLEKNHRDVDALVARGITRLDIKGREEGALEDFRKVIVLSPLYLDAYIGAATCLKRASEREASAEMLNKAHEQCGGDTNKTQYLAATAWQFGHTDFARQLDAKYKDMLSVIEIQQAEYKTTLDKARTLRLDGFTDDAEKIYNELLEKNPNDVDAIAGIGFCKLRDAKRLDEALEDFLRVVELSPLYVDAYIGAAICYKRNGNRGALETILQECREVCKEDEKKSRYLATTAWREGYFPLARDLDDEYPPEKDRTLTKDPWNLRLTYGHSWLERGNDWDEIRLSGSCRVRPDITLSGEYDQWWRYGDSDYSLGAGASYRHDYRWSGRYSYEFSDTNGFLAEQRHSATIEYRLYRSLHVYCGPRLARYSSDWSRRLKAGATAYSRHFFADGNYSFGTDTKNVSVNGYSVSAGYYYELRYSLTAGYSHGDETVDFLRNDELIFRSDIVEAYFLRGSLNFTETFGCSLGGMQEYRNSNLFRRELTLTLFKSF